MLWKVRCVLAWTFRLLGSAAASLMILYAWIVVYPQSTAEEFAENIPFGVITSVFGTFMIFELLGRLLSWTNPYGPLPRFRDRV